MGFRPALGNQLLADSDRKREIGQPAAVEMPQLAASNSKFDAAEPVWGHGDAGPAADLPLDERTDGFSHKYLM